MTTVRAKLFVVVLLFCVGLFASMSGSPPIVSAQFGGTFTSFSTAVSYATTTSSSILTSAQTIAVTSAFALTKTYLMISNTWSAGQKSVSSCPEAGEIPIMFVTPVGELVRIKFTSKMPMDFYLVSSTLLSSWQKYLAGRDCTLPRGYAWSGSQGPNQMSWLRTSNFESDVVIPVAGQFVVVILWTQPIIPSYTIEVTGPSIVEQRNITSMITTNAYQTLEVSYIITMTSTQTALIAQPDHTVFIVVCVMLVVALLAFAAVGKLKTRSKSAV